MVLQKKLELKLELIGYHIKPGAYGNYYHIRNISEQKLIWRDGSDIQEFYVFPDIGVNNEFIVYRYFKHYNDMKCISLHKCEQINFLYKDIDKFHEDIRELIISYCGEKKIPYEFMDYFDGYSIDLSCIEDIIYDGIREGICNDYDKYKEFKWKYDENSNTIKIYDNIIVPDMEEKISTQMDIISFFNRFAHIWNNEIIGKYEHEE